MMKESDPMCEIEESDTLGPGWYFTRKEIEEKSPSRRDGIDLKREVHLRKSYCTLLQNLGIQLKVPQVMIATAIVLCQRFFLRQSHAKNDWRTIATVCMFLAGKVEETPRQLKDVVIVSYELIHKKDPSAAPRIRQKEVYEKQKELLLLGERVVLATLGFDFDIFHPYKPLVDIVKKFKVSQDSIVKVAWNFVNDGLRTSLCLQFRAPQLAVGAIFLAAKFLKLKLPSSGDKAWWQEFNVTQDELEEISNQVLALYDQNCPVQLQSSHPSEVGGGFQPAKTTSVPVNAPSQDLGSLTMSTAVRTELKDEASNAVSKIDKDKVKVAFEKRKKLGNIVPKNMDIIDDADLSIKMAAASMKSEKEVGHKSDDNCLEDGELSSLEEQEPFSPKLQKIKAD